ncbi:MAG: alpha/beta hydrolase [Planctomycetota bacterium]
MRLLPIAAALLLLAVPREASAQATEGPPRQPEAGLSGYRVDYGEVYATRQSGLLKADVYQPDGEGPFPGVVLVHGGAWYMGSRHNMAWCARRLARLGFTAVSISYRLAPQHKFPAQIDDCRDAVRWMRANADRLKIDPQRIGGFGYSAGGHLVALLGATAEADEKGPTAGDTARSSRLQAIAAGGAPCEFRFLPADLDLLTYWLGGPRRAAAEAYRLASPTVFASADDPPMVFWHGSRDRTVPISSARAMVRALRAAGGSAELHVVEGKGHTQAFFDAEAFDACVRFLAEELDHEPRK